MPGTCHFALRYSRRIANDDEDADDDDTDVIFHGRVFAFVKLRSFPELFLL
jgi:hypothetical protein